MLLSEVLDMKPLPYKWQDDRHALFEHNDRTYIIWLEPNTIQPDNRNISLVNVSFGVLKDKKEGPVDSNIDRTLTGHGNPRTILATVANACINNQYIRSFDMIIMAASDNVAKRVHIYMVAYGEIAHHFPEYKHIYNATTPNGTALRVISRIELNEKETAVLGKFLGK